MTIVLQDLISAALTRQPPSITPAVSSPASAASDTSSVTNAANANVSVSSSPNNQIIQTAGLSNASIGIAQVSSLLQVAATGTEQVGSVLQRLQSLANQASIPGESDETLTSIDSEFQQLLAQINGVTSSTSFGGTSLLDGTLSNTQNNAAVPNASLGTTGQALFSSLSIPDLSTSSLFGANTPDILSPTNASAALIAVAAAQNTVSTANASIADTQTQVSYVAAGIDSALANKSAAASTLNESDLANSNSADGLAQFLSNPSAASQTQTVNLPENLLNLLQG